MTDQPRGDAPADHAAEDPSVAAEQRFERMRDAGLILRADRRKLHSSDDTRAATIRLLQESAHRDDGLMTKAIRKLYRAIVG